MSRGRNSLYNGQDWYDVFLTLDYTKIKPVYNAHGA